MDATSIADFVKQVVMGKISVVQHTEQVLSEIESTNSEFNHFNLVAGELALQQAKEIEAQIKTGRHKGKLLGVPISVKDCICVKGIESRAGSKILSGYNPTFDATVIEKARAEGAIIVGKTLQDEFGFGTFSTNTGVDFPTPLNPLDKSRSCGGSSGGSAGFTALTEFTHVGLAESTGGSIACPAAFCGIVGFTPTYGRVSRYGLMDYASSLDKIGTMGKTVADASLLLEIISGHDGNDSTSLPEPVSSLDEGKGEAGLKVGIVKELFEKSDEAVRKECEKAISEMEKLGASVKEVSLPLNSEYGVAAYYLLSMSEASTNLAKFCGMRYGLHGKLEGSFNEYFSKVRSEGFGKEAKRRILLGTFARMSGFRDAYYLRAAKTRTRLINEFKEVFKEVDVLAHPTMPVVAPKFSEIEKLTPLQHYMFDILNVSPNLAGLPHISVPVGKSEGVPIGAMVMSKPLAEGKIIQVAKELEGGFK